MEQRRIVELGVGEVDLVEGLWKELVEHHQSITAELPGRDPEESWRMRRAQYVEWLSAGEATMFLVPGEGAEGAPVAYAVLRVGPAGPTWAFGERTGDLETLCVASAARGTGVGTELLGHCRDHLAALGARWWGVSVAAANGGAIALYEREGFRRHIDHLIAPIG
jgi:ribosomal protein S18 acetylase RimI-like enzyme